ncbi:MAG: fumarate hydratase C-terminal domain-containing protein, partial [Pseudorhodobacter sp.]|nr:fumarate hydratase C-terminal domain-containing protein [Frankiaceae bacterium]
EAVWKIEVEDFPAFVVVDDKGNDFFTDPAPADAGPVPVMIGARPHT